MKARPLLRMNRNGGAYICSFAAILMALFFGGQAFATITIDHFDDNQTKQTLTAPGGVGFTAQNTGGPFVNVLGQYRHMWMKLLAGSISGNTLSTLVASSFFSSGSEPGILGQGYLLWNGNSSNGPDDNSTNPALALNYDLSAVASRFVVTLSSRDLPAGVDMYIDVIDMSGNKSTMHQVMSAYPQDYYFPFASFSGSANFHHVGAIRMYWHGPTEIDFTLDKLNADCVLTEPTITLLTVNGSGSPGSTVVLPPPCETKSITICFTSANDNATVTVTNQTAGGPPVYGPQKPPSGGHDCFTYPSLSTYPTVFFVDANETCVDANATITVTCTEQPSKVPGLNEWGMVLLALVLAAAAIWQLRKKRMS